jgi:hypothetical protein
MSSLDTTDVTHDVCALASMIKSMPLAEIELVHSRQHAVQIGMQRLTTSIARLSSDDQRWAVLSLLYKDMCATIEQYERQLEEMPNRNGSPTSLRSRATPMDRVKRS